VLGPVFDGAAAAGIKAAVIGTTAKNRTIAARRDLLMNSTSLAGIGRPG
jgi:hypothetical protein